MSGFSVAAAAAAFVIAALGGPAAAQDALNDFGTEKTITADGGEVRVGGATVIVKGRAAMVQAAGASVAIHADVESNVDALGAEVTMDGTVGGNVRLGAGSVFLIGNVAGEATIVGGLVTITSDIGGRLRALAGRISIGPQASIAGRAEVVGGNVTLDGHAQGPARLIGGVITINGTVDGNLLLEGGRIIIGPTAVIAGNVTIRSVNEPAIDAGASVTGTVTREAPQTWWEQAGYRAWPFRLAFAAFLAGSTLITGIVLMLLGRGTFEDAVTLARGKVVSSFLIGLASIILLLIGAAALMATLIGIPIGLALLLSLPVLFIVSYAVAAAGLADFIFNRPRAPRIAGRTVVFLIVGAVIIGLLSLIPVAGKILVLLLLVWGIGAFLRSARRRAKRSRRIPAVGGGESPVAA